MVYIYIYIYIYMYFVEQLSNKWRSRWVDSKCFDLFTVCNYILSLWILVKEIRGL
jgi:hypothetical protein